VSVAMITDNKNTDLSISHSYVVQHTCWQSQQLI